MAGSEQPAPTGILLVDKPLGVTSHDVVAMVRRTAGTRKVGHAGTLDPLATGLLVLGLGSSTRLLTFLVGLDKEYLATIRLGESTTTDDAAGETATRADASGVAADELAAQIARLTGDIDQVPSTVSAIRVAGRRAYDLARAGEPVELASRRVRVAAFEVLEERRSGRLIDLDVRVEVSSGTYVRALARDLGAALGVGGHLTALRRTRVGPFPVAEAAAPDDRVLAGLLTPAAIARSLFPVVDLAPSDLTDLVHGKRVAVVPSHDHRADVPVLAAIAPGGRLAGLVETVAGEARVLVNFPTPEVLS